MLKKIISYFDIRIKDIEKEGSKEQQQLEANPNVAFLGDKEKTKEVHWLPQYLSLAAGVFCQPLLQNYQVNGSFGFVMEWESIMFSLIIAIIILPGAYRKTFDSDKPLIAICGVIFTTGIGWQNLVSLA